MHFAQSTLYLATATMLALFDFRQPKDLNEEEIAAILNASDGFMKCAFIHVCLRVLIEYPPIIAILEISNAIFARGTRRQYFCWKS